MGDVHMDKPHRFATGLLPGFQPFADARNRSEGFNFQIDVDLASAEVVDDQNVVALIGQVHRTGPAAEAVAAENQNFHPKLLQERAQSLNNGKLLQGFFRFAIS